MLRIAYRRVLSHWITHRPRRCGYSCHNPNRITNPACRDPVRLWLHTSVRPLGRRQHLEMVRRRLRTRERAGTVELRRNFIRAFSIRQEQPGCDGVGPSPKGHRGRDPAPTPGLPVSLCPSYRLPEGPRDRRTNPRVTLRSHTPKRRNHDPAQT